MCTKQNIQKVQNIVDEGDLLFMRRFQFPYSHMVIGAYDGIAHVGIVFLKNNIFHVNDVTIGGNRALTLENFLNLGKYLYLQVYRPIHKLNKHCLRAYTLCNCAYAGLRVPNGTRHSCTSYVRKVVNDCSIKSVYYDSWRDGVFPSTLYKKIKGEEIYKCGDRYAITSNRLILFVFIALLCKLLFN